MAFKSSGHNNEFSAPEKVLIGNSHDREFIVTWAAKTFIDMDDIKAASTINRTMIEIDKITKDPDPNMELCFRVINTNGSPDIMDQIVFEKFGRIRKILGSAVEEA